jgi:DNA-binding beta-propeller fold protein YncE
MGGFGRLTLAVIFLAGICVADAPPTHAARLPACGSTATPMAPAPVSLLADSATPRSLNAKTLNLVADVPLPGTATRFDYQSFDPTTGWLWISHMDANQLVIVDTQSRHLVGTVDNLPMVTGVLAVPELGRVFASVAGDHRVAIIDAQTRQVIARLGPITFPDGLAYDPGSKRVFVSDESGGGELVIDATTDAVIGTIALGGEAGNTHIDPGSGCVLVAVQSTDELVAIDPTAAKVVSRFSMGRGCQGPHGFAVDAPRRLAFVACEDNATLLVVDLTTMTVTTTFAVGDGPDVLALDPGLGRLYVASEAGVVSVFTERDHSLQPLGEERAPHAHSVAVDPAAHLVYLPLQDVNGKPVLRILAPAA